MSTIQLQSSDGMIVKVELDALKCSGTIKEMVKKTEDGEPEPGEEAVYLENVNSLVLTKILEWAEHHKGDPQPGPEVNGDGAGQAVVVDEWDAAFIEKQHPGDLFELIVAANHLDIKRLLDITTQKVATMIKGKTAEDIRQAFKVKNDFSPGEYDQILKENEWCEQK